MRKNLLKKAIKLFTTQKFDKAEREVLHFLKRTPNDVDALNLLASIYLEQDKKEDAKKIYAKAISIDPSDYSTYSNLSLVYFQEHNYKKARETIQYALNLHDSDAILWMNYGNFFLEDGYYKEAEEAYSKALSFRQDIAKIYYNAAKLYMETNNYKNAKEMFEKALSLSPNNPDILLEYAFLYLKLKVYKPGFELYRARYAEDKTDKQTHIISTEKLLQRGNLLRGKKLLLTYEQGFGDIIQFSRYISLYLEMGAKVFVKVKTLLYDLLKVNFPTITHLQENEFVAYDYHLPIMDSAYYFLTEYETIPYQEGFLGVNQIDSRNIEKKYFQSDTNKKRIGIVWRTNHVQGESFKKQKERLNRNIPLEKMIQYFQHKDVQLYSMQVAVTQEERTLLEKHNIPSLGDNLVTFYDNALIIDNLDMLIAIDTVSTILAGAMGKEAIVLLSGNADWRWGVQDKHTNWFKTITIYRKSLEGTWDIPLKEIAQQQNLFSITTKKQRMLNKALIYHKQHKIQDAKLLYENVLSQDPNNADAFYNYGLLLYETGYIQEAMELISVAAKLDPGNQNIYESLKEIVANLKLTEFEKEYLAFDLREFNIQKFNIRKDLQQLSQEELRLLHKIKKQVDTIKYDVLLSDTIKLYINLLEGNFYDALVRFLDTAENPEVNLEKFNMLYNISTNLDGFYLSSDEVVLIAKSFYKIFQDENISQEFKIRFIPIYYNFYLLERNIEFMTSLPFITTLFQYCITQEMDIYLLLTLYDMITFIYWGTTQDIESLKECDDTIIKPLSKHLLRFFKKEKIKPRTHLSAHSKKRVCYLGHKTSYEGAYAVGRVLYSLFKGHYKLNSGNFDFYYYASNDVDEKFLQEIKDFGFTVRRFDNITNLQEKLQIMRQSFTKDEIDITISEMPWAVPTYLFESRVSPIQIYDDMGFSSWSIENKDLHATERDVNFLTDKRYFHLSLGIDEKFILKTISSKVVKNEKDKYPQGYMILGATQRLVKLTEEYVNTIITILKENPNTIFIAAGNGDKTGIQQLIKSHKLENRFFLPGYVDSHIYANIFDIYLDTFPFPSGLSSIEAMAYKKPLVHKICLGFDNYKNIKDPDLITNDTSSYIAIVNRLISDKKFYDEKSQISKQLAYKLMDVTTPASEMEQAIAQHIKILEDA